MTMKTRMLLLIILCALVFVRAVPAQDLGGTEGGEATGQQADQAFEAAAQEPQQPPANPNQARIDAILTEMDQRLHNMEKAQGIYDQAAAEWKGSAEKYAICKANNQPWEVLQQYVQSMQSAQNTMDEMRGIIKENDDARVRLKDELAGLMNGGN